MCCGPTTPAVVTPSSPGPGSGDGSPTHVANANRLTSCTGPGWTSPGGRSTWYRVRLQHAYGCFLGVEDRGGARTQLRAAARSYRQIGARPFLERCQADLAQLGESGPTTEITTTTWLHRLTDRERETAALVARGWTNPEIAGTQCVSPKTVEYHLRNIYNKLGIPDRRALRDALQDAAPASR